MKKILNVLLLTLITVSLSYSQRIEQNDLYTVVYSESYQQPLYLTYKYPYFLTNEYEIIKGVVLEGKDIEKSRVVLDVLGFAVRFGTDNEKYFQTICFN